MKLFKVSLALKSILSCEYSGDEFMYEIEENLCYCNVVFVYV